MYQNVSNILKEYQADNVGGAIKTIPQKNTLIAKAIAICLSSFLGAGTSYFRIGTKESRWVDTVFGGCYKKEVFEKIGLFDERLIRSQDIEFNRRLRKAGGKILLVPEIKAFYYPHSNFRKFLKHNFNDGFWTTYPLKFGIRIFSWRHLLPLIFVSGLIGLFLLSLFSKFFFFLFLLALFFYFLMNLYFSLKIAKREKDLRFLFLMPITFVSRHLGYGLGSLWGLIKP
jgi:GT2 family glycosyltransferase